MLEKNIREQINELIHQQVVPAVGCTEPMAVALCTARATELLGRRPEHISVLLSANILKNAMGVGIPGTGMIGLPIAIALGALIGKSEYQLEVIKDLTPDTLEAGKTFISENRIDVKLKEVSQRNYTSKSLVRLKDIVLQLSSLVLIRILSLKRKMGMYCLIRCNPALLRKRRHHFV